MTTPDYVPAMKRAAGIVTDEGGRLCHAAIVSRELGVPCVVGSGNATSVLAMGREVTVDGSRGVRLRRPRRRAPGLGRGLEEAPRRDGQHQDAHEGLPQPRRAQPRRRHGQGERRRRRPPPRRVHRRRLHQGAPPPLHRRGPPRRLHAPGSPPASAPSPRPSTRAPSSTAPPTSRPTSTATSRAATSTSSKKRTR